MCKVYYFKVHTADQVFAGTDSNIFVTLYGDKGRSIERRLNGNIPGNAFERNKTDIFKVEYDKDCGNIYRIELRSDGMYAGSAWLCDYIEISATDFEGEENKKQISKFIFPTGEWINDTKVRVMDATEGYNFSLIASNIREKEITGEIIHIPPYTEYEHTVTYETSTLIDYKMVNVINIETHAQEEISADVIKVIFDTKIVSEVSKTYNIIINKKTTEQKVFRFDKCEVQRNLKTKYAIKDYDFEAKMENLKFNFNLPNYKVFIGFVDDTDHVDKSYHIL